MSTRKRLVPVLTVTAVAWLSNPVLSFSSGHRGESACTISPARYISRSSCRRWNLRAASADPLSGGELADQHRKSAGWHRTVLKKVFRTSKKSLKMKETVVEDSTRTPKFLLDNFNDMSPAKLFGASLAAPTPDLGTFKPLSLATLPFQEEVTHLCESDLHDSTVVDNDAPESDSRSSLLTRITSSVAENFLSGFIDRLSQGSHENLAVKCAPNGNALDLLRGHFQSDASVEFDRLVFPCIRMSGGRLEAHRLAINFWGFTTPSSSFSSSSLCKSSVKPRRRRYPNQFDLVAHNMKFTEKDLYESDCIRNGLQRLIIRILKNHMTFSRVVISSIKILANGKIAIKGEASTGFSLPVPFEVRSFLRSCSRGHVVTFPGLEISFGPTFVRVPVLPEVSLDLGHNAQVLRLEVNGQHSILKVSARATITPHHTLKLKNYVQAKDSFSAPFSVDVGEWLTSKGNFTH